MKFYSAHHGHTVTVRDDSIYCRRTRNNRYQLVGLHSYRGNSVKLYKFASKADALQYPKL